MHIKSQTDPNSRPLKVKLNPNSRPIKRHEVGDKPSLHLFQKRELVSPCRRRHRASRLRTGISFPLPSYKKMVSLVSDPSIPIPPLESTKLSVKEVKVLDSQIEVKLQIPSTPAVIPAPSAPAYAERFKASFRNLRKISDPTYLEDGTPKRTVMTLNLAQGSGCFLEKERKREKRERERGERGERERGGESSPELVAGATTRQTVELTTTIIRSQSPSSCSSRRDEAVDTKHASNGARTKPYAPPENRPSRARETHAPSPPANFPVSRRRR
ncbi:hypothetical protein YC2023_019827 [Brassica napus]